MKSFALLTVKSKACAIGEIETFGFGEFKSVHQPDEVGFHRKAISSIKDGFIQS